MGLFGKQKPTKKIDALVTGLILGGTIATIYGLKKRKQNKETSSTETEPSRPSLFKRAWGSIF